MAKEKPIKALPIRSHDTRSFKGRRTVRARLAERALNNAPAEVENESQTVTTARQALQSLLDSEWAMGRHGSYKTAKFRATAERAALAARAKVDPLAKLKYDTQRAGEAYMRSLRQSGIVSGEIATPEKRVKKQGKTLQGLHRSYAQMMVVSAMRPLQQGVNANSVLQTLGMTTAMFITSKNFRSLVGEMRPRFLSAIKDKIAERVTSEGRDRIALRKAAKAEEKGKPLSAWWQSRLDRMERGNRDPFTTRSAAMTEVSLIESAYAAMRDPRVPESERAEHIKNVQQSFTSAMGILNAYVHDDGLDREEVSQAARVIIGQRLEAEPELASVFMETGHGQFVKTDSQEVVVDRTGRKERVWDGSFVDAVTDKVVIGGSFQLRMPGTRGDHVVMCSRTLEGELEDAKSLNELNDIFSSYTAAGVVRRYPGMSNDVENPEVAKRMKRTERMFQSMRDDGLSMMDQRLIYTSAFIDAMERVGEKNPELMAEWEAQYGPEWRQNVTDTVNKYSDLGKSVERDRLIDELTAMGYSTEDAEREVEQYQKNEDIVSPAKEAAREYDPAPIRTASKIYDEKYPLMSEFEPPKFGPNMSKQDKALVLVDSMSDYVSGDILAESDRHGFYNADGSELVSADEVNADDPDVVYLSSDGCVASAMKDWRDIRGSVAEGHKIIESGEKPVKGTRAYRLVAMAEMDNSMVELNIPQKTRDSMMAASYVRGLEKSAEFDANVENAVAHGMLKRRLAGSWQDNAYKAAMSNTETQRAWESTHIKVGDHKRTEDVVREYSNKDSPSQGRYDAWERQFDRLDKIDVPGQSKVGELEVPGSDSERDNVVAEIDESTKAVGSKKETISGKIKRRGAFLRARINREYNREDTGLISGVGSDNAEILQDGEPTLGD